MELPAAITLAVVPADTAADAGAADATQATSQVLEKRERKLVGLKISVEKKPRTLEFPT